MTATLTQSTTDTASALVKVRSQFDQIEYMPRSVFEQHYDGLGWYYAGEDDLTDLQRALVQQATPRDGRWFVLPEPDGAEDTQALFGLTDKRVAYRSCGEWLLTATGRSIHRYLTAN